MNAPSDRTEKPDKTARSDDRRMRIIEAAIRRFSHFGIDKTLMSEVAEDVKISKANLYYYFPDKWSLIDAIADTILTESDQEIRQILENERDQGTEHVLQRILDIKLSYFNKYKLLVQDLDEAHLRDERFQGLSDRIFERERQHVSEVLEQGIRSGELVTMEVAEMSDTYTVIMRGLVMYCMYTHPPHLVDADSLQKVHERQREFVQIFVRGIRRK